MKRWSLLICVIVLAVLHAACQRTPEEEIVIKKHQDEMIEAAQPAETESAEAVAGLTIQTLDAPQTCVETLESGRLNIVVDAKVIVPESEALPIVRAEGADFSQEQVTVLFDYFCGDTQMYTVADEMTKDVIQEQIVSLKALIAKEENKDDADPDDLERYERMLKKAQDALPNAPDTYEKILSDGTLKTVIEKHPLTKIEVGRYTALAAASDTKDFRVTNNSDREEIISYVKEDGSGGGGKTLKTRASLSYKVDNDMSFSMGGKYHIDETTESQQHPGLLSIGITPGEARQMVETVLEELNLPMAVKDMYLIDDGYDDGSGYKQGDNFAYQVECLRIINNVPCALIDGSATGGSSSGEGFAPDPSWFYESLVFWVNDDGIINMKWVSPMAVKDTVVENCTLLPFPDIRDVFLKMMPVIYEYDANQAEKGTTITINEIELELVRVSEQNSIKNGLLVPAWRFYGISDLDSQSAYECFLTVNAVDGSVINTDIGY